MNLSPHFTLAELVRSQRAARDGIDNMPSNIIVTRLMALCEYILEPIRLHFGPVHISSGYRSPLVNKAELGSRTSQHMRGEAADIEVPGVANVNLCEWIMSARLPFDQLILEFYRDDLGSAGWVHVSHSLHGNRAQVLRTTDGRTYQDGLPQPTLS